MNKNNSEQVPLSRNVWLMGMTSFFTDISSEMIYPLLQAFVTIVMGSAKAMVGPILGVIEGIAEATASLLKVYSGYLSDKVRKRKPLTITGYTVSAFSKLLFLLTGFGWIFILLARFSDRVGKGIRTAPRDALIAESTDPSIQGKAYGFHRAMDYLGALLGVVIVYFISLRYLDPVQKTITDLNSFYILFIISLIPALIGVVILFFVKEEKITPLQHERPPVSFSLKNLNGNLKLFLLAIFVFGLGNSSNQFLLLRSMNSGISLPDVLVMYMLFNLTTSALSTQLGSLSDKIGRKKVILTGYLLYAFIYVMFGFITPSTNHYLWFFWILYGIYYALTEGIEKALVSDLSPAEKKGSIMGLFNTITGIALLPASIGAGILYTYNPAAPFIFGGVTAVLAFLIIALFLREKRSG